MDAAIVRDFPLSPAASFQAEFWHRPTGCCHFLLQTALSRVPFASAVASDGKSPVNPLTAPSPDTKEADVRSVGLNAELSESADLGGREIGVPTDTEVTSAP